VNGDPATDGPIDLSGLGYEPMPWANGGGITWEVARAPSDPGSAFAWRVSIAAITGPGPFSALPGIERTLTLLRPSSITLAINGTPWEVQRGEPLRFSGEDDVASTSAGAATALNVMTRRGYASAQVATVTVDGTSQLHRDGCDAAWLVVMSGEATATDGRGARSLIPGQTVAIEHDPVAVAGACTLAVIRIAAAAATAQRAIAPLPPEPPR
jgi:uncharacterized protein